jgi:hypothetical protein
LLVQQPKIVTVWLQLLLLPQPSTSDHVWVTDTFGQTPLVTMLVDVMRTLVRVPAEVTMPLAQQVVAVGWSNDQGLPHCTDLLAGHCTCKQGCATPQIVTRM